MKPEKFVPVVEPTKEAAVAAADADVFVLGRPDDLVVLVVIAVVVPEQATALLVGMVAVAPARRVVAPASAFGVVAVVGPALGAVRVALAGSDAVAGAVLG